MEMLTCHSSICCIKFPEHRGHFHLRHHYCSEKCLKYQAGEDMKKELPSPFRPNLLAKESLP